MKIEVFKKEVKEIVKNGDLEKEGLFTPLESLYADVYFSSKDEWKATIVKLYEIEGNRLLGKSLTIKEVKKFVEDLLSVDK